jgi:signal peptidase I
MNFSLILFIMFVLTGIIWCYDRFVLRKKRMARAQELLAQFDATSIGMEAGQRTQEREKLRHDSIKPPIWVEYTGDFFPIITIVFFLRSFLIEPFRIPSGSMIPTLLVGDLILVNKYAYGIRLPVMNKKIVEVGQPQRGDVMVFRYPMDPKFDYIKRVIGVSGDVVEYREKKLSINGQPVAMKRLEPFFDQQRLVFWPQFSEKIGTVEHKILNYERVPAGVDPWEFSQRNLCSYDASGFRCTVPLGHYFMMGDNRDDSQDSRFWGFVPDKNVVGKAFFVWLSLDGIIPSFSRFGSFN